MDVIIQHIIGTESTVTFSMCHTRLDFQYKITNRYCWQLIHHSGKNFQKKKKIFNNEQPWPY